MDTPNAPAAMPVLFIDDPHAPEFFASALSGAGFDGANVRLAFESARHTHDPGNNKQAINRVVNVRIVMSVPQAMQMVNFLNNFLQTAALNQIERPDNRPMQ